MGGGLRVDIGKLVGICEERGEKERNEMVKVGGEEDIYLDDKKRDKTALEKEAQNENGREREREMVRDLSAKWQTELRSIYKHTGEINFIINTIKRDI